MSWEKKARRVARAEGVDEDVFVALVRQESGGRMVRSGAGAIGPAQLMPGTAEELGVNPNDYMDNLRGGARYLKAQLERFGNLKHALAAYNAGPGAVEAAGGVPDFRETQDYVQRIMGSLGDKDLSEVAAPGRSGGGSLSAPEATISLGTDGPTREEAVLGWLQGEKRDPLELATDVATADAQSEQTMTVPGVKINGAPNHDVGEIENGPRLRSGNLRELGQETIEFFREMGYQPGSMGRSRADNQRVGGAEDSDHLDDEGTGFGDERLAIDIPAHGEKGRAAAIRAAERFGIKGYDGDGFATGVIKIGKQKARVQIGYGDSVDHGDHVHVGFRVV